MGKYYWLKLKDDFFTSKRIKKLRNLAGGDTLTIIYLKMQLKSVKTGGVLSYTGLERTFAEELALDLDESPEDVGLLLNYLLSVGLIETSDNINFMLPYAVDNVGSEGDSAQRVRAFRERQNKENPKLLQCNADVTQVKQICNVDIDIDKDIEKDNIYRSTSDEVIDYLNLKAHTNYRHVDGNRKLISARLKEGFSVEDCKTVIDKKCEDWIGTEYEQYLRPKTLFGNKFEGYLNSRVIKKQPVKFEPPDYFRTSEQMAYDPEEELPFG